MLMEPMFALLVLAASLYLVLGDLTEGLTLFVFVLAVLALTFYQEGKSEAAIDALRQLSQPFAQVMRDGQRTSVPSREVVVGDVFSSLRATVLPPTPGCCTRTNCKWMSLC